MNRPTYITPARRNARPKSIRPLKLAIIATLTIALIAAAVGLL